ncbi:MAG: T9SS type A sorting domain-containing protein [Flavobacteriales bacterium]
MNLRTLLSTGPCMLALTVAAQTQQPLPDAPQARGSHSAILHDPSDRAVIWQEDFGAGFPAGWTLQDASGICPWRYSFHGSAGFYAGIGDSIVSTTSSNGFLINDPDSANDANYGQPSGTTYQYLSTYVMTSAIDLTGHPDVKLEFTQYFRYNNAPTLDVMVSNDGTNWTTWDVKGTVQANTASANNMPVSINISAVAGDQATVYVKIGWSARVYFWMIDDIAIIDAQQHDLRLNESMYDEWFFDTAVDFGDLQFSVYPASQVRPLTFKGHVSNEGAQDENNTALTVTVTDGGGNVEYTASSAGVTIASGDRDSLYVAAWTPGTAADDHTVAFVVASDSTDQVPGDNVDTLSFAVSQYSFARDRGSLTGRDDNGGEAYELGNWFNMVNDGDMLTAVDVAIDDDTPEGILVYGTLYDVDRNVIAITEDGEVGSGDLNAPGGNTFKSLVFDPPVELVAGDYLVTVGHYGGSDNLWTGTSGVSLPQTSLIYDSPTATWFYVTTTPMVRMNFDPAVGVHETATTNDGLAVYPSPASDAARLTFSLQNASDVQVILHDAAGRVVARQDEGKLAPGLQLIDISTAQLPNGLYACTLLTAEGQRTVRLQVAH